MDKKTLIILTLIALLLACVKPTEIRLPTELEFAKELPVVGLETSPTLEFGPFNIFNIQEKDGQLLYLDYKTDSWEIDGFEFFLTDEKDEQWECICEYPTDKGTLTSFLRCEFKDKTPPEGLWTLSDSILSTNGDNIKIIEYYGDFNQGEFTSALPIGYLFKIENEVRGLVYLSATLRESVWIFPYMDPHRQRAIAAAAAALILKNRKLQLGPEFKFRN